MNRKWIQSFLKLVYGKKTVYGYPIIPSLRTKGETNCLQCTAGIQDTPRNVCI